MSEGGIYPWKRQTIEGNPVADYSCLNQPLPQLPKGQQWIKEGREWRIVDVLGAAIPLKTDANVLVKERVPDNCDFVQHFVKPTDTLQGLCLKYGVTPVVLRQVNKFSGSNLNLAPQTLVIPLEKSRVVTGKKEQELSSEGKINKFILAFRNNKASTLVSRKEAIAYLDMNDGNLELAIEDAKEDFGWEIGENEESPLL
mmetsp:Transcript_6409/g.7953  ORF Transcript_6409/g.7953 Transcript_6409/m.7953 type:complete len:199 (+) Transcript_6409:100-696(+)